MSAVHDLRRAARNLGGENVRTVSHYDHERGGRVIELTVFFPGNTGYNGFAAFIEERKCDDE